MFVIDTIHRIILFVNNYFNNFPDFSDSYLAYTVPIRIFVFEQCLYCPVLDICFQTVKKIRHSLSDSYSGQIDSDLRLATFDDCNSGSETLTFSTVWMKILQSGQYRQENYYCLECLFVYGTVFPRYPYRKRPVSHS